MRFIRGVIDETGEEVQVDWHGHRDRGLDIPNCFAALKIRSTSKNAGLGTPSKLTRPFWCSGGCGRGFPPSQPGRTRNSCRAK